jgi:hypothetical protein
MSIPGEERDGDPLHVENFFNFPKAAPETPSVLAIPQYTNLFQQWVCLRTGPG